MDDHFVNAIVLGIVIFMGVPLVIILDALILYYLKIAPLRRSIIIAAIADPGLMLFALGIATVVVMSISTTRSQVPPEVSSIVFITITVILSALIKGLVFSMLGGASRITLIAFSLITALIPTLLSIRLLSGLLSSQQTPVDLGNPTWQCTFSSNRAVARLYVDEQRGVLRDSFYIVTYQDKEHPETQVFSSTSSPTIHELKCKDDTLVLMHSASDSFLELPLEWIRTDLVNVPIRLRKGWLLNPEYSERLKGRGGIYIPTPTPSPEHVTPDR